MSDERDKAKELYQRFGLKKANFLAFDEMQAAGNEKDVDYWLRVINQIALLDLQSLKEKDDSTPTLPSDKWGNA